MEKNEQDKLNAQYCNESIDVETWQEGVLSE